LAGAQYRADLAPCALRPAAFRVQGSGVRRRLGSARRPAARRQELFERVERIAPKRKFTVYVVPHTHLDIGFTDYQPKIEELQNRNLDRLLEEMRGDADMRFSLDGAWLAEQYLRTRSPAAQKEFLDSRARGPHLDSRRSTPT
jgi:hypothetical protein